jgi:hypothetical protein
VLVTREGGGKSARWVRGIGWFYTAGAHLGKVVETTAARGWRLHRGGVS